VHQVALTREGTATALSVIRVTTEAPPVTVVTCPTGAGDHRRATSMPRELPWSMVTVENQAVGDWAMTRALTSSRPRGRARRSSASSFSYWAFWRRASLPARAWRLAAFRRLEVLEAPLGADRVAGPAHEVPCRLEHPRGALLGSGRGPRAPRCTECRPPPLAEEDGQEQERRAYEQAEGYPPAPSGRTSGVRGLTDHGGDSAHQRRRFLAPRLVL
jgi:hypothetical protein